MSCPQQIRGLRSEVTGKKSELGYQKSDVRDPMSEAGEEALHLQAFIEGAYCQGIAAHGALGFALGDFAAHLDLIVIKQLGEDAGSYTTIDFLARLDLEDLYLAAACAINIPAAWERLFSVYSEYVTKVAHQICLTHQQARDLAGDVLTHLFFEDRSGRRRIASYEGRGSLRTWLSTAITGSGPRP
jgi:hypothetical protein